MEIFLTYILPALISAIAGVGLGIGQNVTNKKSVEDTNQANLQAVRETNASNVEQANLAYQRSLPINQVKDLMDAGMSRAGALNMLTGGGTYTAPVLQSSHGDSPQMDFSSIANSIERLTGVPSNVEQHKMMQLQRESLEQEIRLRDLDEQRKQEQHQYDMWLKTYGKKSTEMIDALSSKIVSIAADKGINLADIDSVDKLVKVFDLGNDEIWRNMPAQARWQVLEAVRLQAAENRSNQSAIDSHNAAIDERRAASDKHDFDVKQLEKLKLEIQDYNDERDARKKEYSARKVRAIAQQMADSYDLSMSLSHALSVFEIDKDGNIKFDSDGLPVYRNDIIKENEQGWSEVREFWNKCFEVIPANILLRALSSVFK